MLIQKLIVYGCLGVMLEVFFTGFHSIIILRNRSAISRTSLWMIPVYGGGALWLGFLRTVVPLPIMFVPLATLSIFAAEYVAGWIFRKLGIRIWDYSHSKFSIQGLIRVDYLPFWLMVAVAFDQLSDYVAKIMELVGKMA